MFVEWKGWNVFYGSLVYVYSFPNLGVRSIGRSKGNKKMVLIRCQIVSWTGS